MNTTNRKETIEALADIVLAAWKIGRELGASDDMLEVAIASELTRRYGASEKDARKLSSLARSRGAAETYIAERATV